MIRPLRGLYAAVILALFTCVSLVSPAFAAPGVTADIKVSVIGTYAGANDLGTPVLPLSQLATVGYTPGTGTGAADLVFADQRTLTASSTENLDLAGTLTDPFGVTLTCAKVKAIYVFAAAANTNDVIVGGAASNAFTGPFQDATDKVAVRPGGVAVFALAGTGWTVTASTGDILKVANGSSGTSVTYDVIVICTSA